MKDGIHPKLYTNTVVTCACGNSFVTASTVEKIHVEICSNCHPFYTGTQKLIDTEGRVEKFAKRQAQAEVSAKNKKDKEEKAKTETRAPRSLKEMFETAEESQTK